MISNSAKYAIKAVIYLGLHSGLDKKILTRDMFDKIQVSESYLAKILQELARHNIISSSKGRNGGFYITEANAAHSLIDIVRLVDGDQSVDSCILGISQCSMEHPCPLHHVVGKNKQEFNAMLARTRINDLIKEMQGTEVYFPF
jgi:Rrf2 family protein